MTSPEEGVTIKAPAAHERESILRNNIWIKGGLAAVGAAAAVAGTLAFATGGKAASPNVCTTSSNLTAFPKIYASCVKEAVFPHTLSAGLDFASGQAAVASTKFTNQSGIGGATATHTALIATFSSPVQVDSITVYLSGVKVNSPTCTATASTATCSDIGNVPGGSTARMIVQFSTATTGTLTIFGTATYGESGNDNPGGPNGTTNDRQQSAPDTVAVVAGGLVQSKCTSSDFALPIAGDSTISSTLSYVKAADSNIAGICTPAATGVIPNSTGVHTEVAFFDVPTLFGGTTAFGGLATFKLFITPLPSGVTVKNAPIFEDVSAAQDFSSFIVVPPCTSSGSPPNPGVPAAAASALTNNQQVNDSCIYNRATLPRGGGEFDLHVFGSAIDAKYSG